MFTVNLNLNFRPVIGIDLDNTLADTDQIIRKIIFERLNIISTKGQITSWSYSESLGFPKAIEEEIFSEFHKNYLSKISIKDNAQKALTIIKKEYLVWIITHRPKSTKRDTELWLSKNKLHYNKLIFTKNKTKFYRKLLFLIEDNGENAKIFADKWGKVFLFDSPWNFEYKTKNIIRVTNWNEIINHLNNNIP